MKLKLVLMAYILLSCTVCLHAQQQAAPASTAAQASMTPEVTSVSTSTGKVAESTTPATLTATVLQYGEHDVLRLKAKLRYTTLIVLPKDRDIRELMGARDLYIAEVYDVAGQGATNKPYGRLFYTKGKSLIFYAYDLDQQRGLKNASTFQAWGRRGPNWKQATNLGVFYEDSAAKKRWVLRFDDPKKLAEIDAVFVTVEPNGGSQKPSGQRLLFAYLKIEPNHP